MPLLHDIRRKCLPGEGPASAMQQLPGGAFAFRGRRTDTSPCRRLAQAANFTTPLRPPSLARYMARSARMNSASRLWPSSG